MKRVYWNRPITYFPKTNQNSTKCLESW